MIAAELSSRVAGALRYLLLPLTIAGLVIGAAFTWAGDADAAAAAWALPTLVVAVRLAISIVRDLLARDAGVDVIALLAIGGALALGETFAASVIAVMLATGEALETYAEGRAQRELAALIGRAPNDVHRYRDGQLETVPLATVAPGDLILVRSGEVVPVDGLVRDAAAVLDESALTGESRLVTRQEGEIVSSGVVNAGGSFDLQAVATAEESTYAGIVRLVEEAGRAKAPFVRLADRYALLFVPLALAISAAAWIVSGDPVRGLAVLVVATPCPLLLAAPIAIVAGISRAARRGIIVKGGGPLETLARARVLLFDKTGTLTAGRPRLTSVHAPNRDPDEVLRFAAALEQASPHVLAGAIVHAGRRRGWELALPYDTIEEPGSGIAGLVDGREVGAGSAAFVAPDGLPAWARDVRRRSTLDGSTCVFVRLDGELAGVLLLDDPIRPETARAVRSLRRAGFTRIVMVTGDRHAVAEIVGAAVGLDGVLAGLTPGEKVEAVTAERAQTEAPLVMVGDGVNDAPALAAADVGVAMGARGATASSEAADVVITVDRLDRLAEGVGIARHSRSIALQSVVGGMGMSIVAMAAAAVGLLPVVAGALLQEVIDVVAILSALRALRGGVERPVRIEGWEETGSRLLETHRALAPGLARLRVVADALDDLEPAAARRDLQDVRTFLVESLVPHEQEEDRAVYPVLASALRTDEATAAMHRTHTEIFHLVRLYDRLVTELGPDGPDADDRTDLRRALYGLDAIVRLHMAQEEELYDALREGSAQQAAQPAA